MSSRDAILAAVRAARPVSVALPELRSATRQFEQPPGDVASRFVQAARAAGSNVAEASSAEVARTLHELANGSTRRLSSVPAIESSMPAADDPHALSDLELCACESPLGVAESGAVWLSPSTNGARAALFLAERVVVVLRRESIVSDLHQAYERLDVRATPFGLFVAGPSKTADIEQALVVGAHGPRQMTIVLLD
jgi:L-lactate dehydrogenase complex protein LldG